MIGDPMPAYRCSPSITWVKDSDQTILVEEEKGQSWSIHGVEAVIWDLLTLHYSLGRIVRFLSVLLNGSKDEAIESLLVAIQRWEEAGIICAMKGNGRG